MCILYIMYILLVKRSRGRGKGRGGRIFIRIYVYVYVHVHVSRLYYTSSIVVLLCFLPITFLASGAHRSARE